MGLGSKSETCTSTYNGGSNIGCGNQRAIVAGSVGCALAIIGSPDRIDPAFAVYGRLGSHG